MDPKSEKPMEKGYLLQSEKSRPSGNLYFSVFACPLAVVCIEVFWFYFFSIVVLLIACGCFLWCLLFMSWVLLLFSLYDNQVLYMHFACSSLSVSSLIRGVVRIRVPFGCRLRMPLSCMQVPSGCRLRMTFICCISVFLLTCWSFVILQFSVIVRLLIFFCV